MTSLCGACWRRSFRSGPGLPVRAVPSAGWDNVIYRLGTDLAVGLPRREVGAPGRSARSTGGFQHWPGDCRLPSRPWSVGGMPGEGYPWSWSVVTWLPGEIAAASRDLDMTTAALRLAGFVAALWAIDPAGGPASEFRRDLAGCDRQLADAVDALRDVPYREAAIRAWRHARAAPPKAARHYGKPGHPGVRQTVITRW